MILHREPFCPGLRWPRRGWADGHSPTEWNSASCGRVRQSNESARKRRSPQSNHRNLGLGTWDYEQFESVAYGHTPIEWFGVSGRWLWPQWISSLCGILIIHPQARSPWSWIHEFSKEDHTATLLANGQILLAAGDYYDANNNYYALATADLFIHPLAALEEQV